MDKTVEEIDEAIVYVESLAGTVSMDCPEFYQALQIVVAYAKEHVEFEKGL